MTTSRRNLLKVGLGALPVISLSGTMPAFVSQLAFAETAVRPELANDNILVVLQLTGGNDGLNTVIPYGDDSYFKARPKIGIKDRNTARLDDHFALNPSLFLLKSIYDAGQLAIVHGCGDPNPNRSHFRSMEIWHTANPAKAQPTGWLGHYLDHAARGSTVPINPLNIGAELPQALVNLGTPVPSIEKLEDFRLKSHTKAQTALLERDIVMEMNRASDDQPPAMKYLARQATNAIIATGKVHAMTKQGPTGAYYGMPGLGAHMQLISSLISANA